MAYGVLETLTSYRHRSDRSARSLLHASIDVRSQFGARAVSFGGWVEPRAKRTEWTSDRLPHSTIRAEHDRSDALTENSVQHALN